METMNNYNGTILIVDLDAKSCSTQDLTEELIEKALGGAAGGEVLGESKVLGGVEGFRDDLGGLARAQVRTREDEIEGDLK